MLGSPFPLFVHINRTQVIARKVHLLLTSFTFLTVILQGRERTMHSPPDEAVSPYCQRSRIPTDDSNQFDREGIFGCLAVDAVYNIFNPSDPVA